MLTDTALGSIAVASVDRLCYNDLMSTILKSGKRRCDAVCHTAHGSKCGCVCNGKFHGAAVNRSKSAERAEIEEVVLAGALKLSQKAVELLKNEAEQPSLFTDEDLTAAYSACSELDEAHERLRVAAAQQKMIEGK